MALLVNGQRIENEAVEAEVARLRQTGVPQWERSEPFTSLEEVVEHARNNVVNRVLLQQESERRDVPLSEEELQAGIDELMGAHGGASAFYARYGLSAEDAPRIRQHVAETLKVEHILDEACADVTEPDDAECRQHYEAHLEEFVRPAQVHCSHIVKRPAGDDADEVYERMRKLRLDLANGADFKAAAAEHSDCEDDGAGELGWISPGQMVPEFEAVVFSLRDGEISPVFLTQFGYHIATVTGSRDAAQLPFEDARETIAAQLYQERMHACTSAFFAELRSRADIKVLEGDEDEGQGLIVVPGD